MNVRPDDRLTSAAAFVRQGACFADIGTDHAILPVFLYKSQKISRAYACDIAHGPCEKARAQVRAAGLCDAIEVVQTDGLSGLDQKGITDIAICGMGGELIASIVDAAPWIKDRSVRLILQPMTKAPQLRSYLAEAGFSVLKEITALKRTVIAKLHIKLFQHHRYFAWLSNNVLNFNPNGYADVITL